MKFITIILFCILIFYSPQAEARLGGPPPCNVVQLSLNKASVVKPKTLKNAYAAGLPEKQMVQQLAQLEQDYFAAIQSNALYDNKGRLWKSWGTQNSKWRDTGYEYRFFWYHIFMADIAVTLEQNSIAKLHILHAVELLMKGAPHTNPTPYLRGDWQHQNVYCEKYIELGYFVKKGLGSINHMASRLIDLSTDIQQPDLASALKRTFIDRPIGYEPPLRLKPIKITYRRPRPVPKISLGELMKIAAIDFEAL
ncbi:hypothetical protein [Hirschia maritima]|uniref:hypothetical protein n=1 Tax=Hirschia maritima TaxID=1121961 RepID=UPI0003A197BA|nr:hypothetical protein [Hirschia maritima]